MPVDISNDVDNLVIAFIPGVSILGHVSIEDGAAFSSLPDQIQRQSRTLEKRIATYCSGK